MSIKNIAFDFDGTLVDTAPIILATMAETIRELGLPARTEEQCRATIGLRLADIPAALFPDIPDISLLYADTYRRIFAEKNSSSRSEIFTGVSDTLALFHNNGINMAVASSRSHRSLVEFLDETELTRYFKMVIGGDDVTCGKPAPEPVVTICGNLNWNPSQTLVVGDAGVDILMGKAAGCSTCGVTYGNGTLQELKSAGADHIISSFNQLIAVI